MRITETRAAAERCVWRRQPDHFFEPELPDKFTVHAIVNDSVRMPSGRLDNYEWKRLTSFKGGIDFESGVYNAACGKPVRVVMPFEFDDEDPDLCERCLDQVRLYSQNPGKWVGERRARRRQKIDAEFAAADAEVRETLRNRDDGAD